MANNFGAVALTGAELASRPDDAESPKIPNVILRAP